MRFMVFYVTQFLTVSLISTDVKQGINVKAGMVRDYSDSKFCIFNDALKIILIKL